MGAGDEDLAPGCHEGCWDWRDQEGLALVPGPGFFCGLGDVAAEGNFGAVEEVGKPDFKLPKSANGSLGFGLLCGIEPFVTLGRFGDGTLLGCRNVADELPPQPPIKSTLLLA